MREGHAVGAHGDAPAALDTLRESMRWVSCFHCHDVPQEIRRCVHVLDESEVRPGDWLCYECNTVVFASKHRCYKCKAPRYGAEPVIRFPVHTYKHGDWCCATCSFMNYRHRRRCFVCHLKK